MFELCLNLLWIVGVYDMLKYVWIDYARDISMLVKYEWIFRFECEFDYVYHDLFDCALVQSCWILIYLLQGHYAYEMILHGMTCHTRFMKIW